MNSNNTAYGRRKFLTNTFQAGSTLTISGIFLQLACQRAVDARSNNLPSMLSNDQLILANKLVYRPFSVEGELMDDSIAVRGLPDGMGAFKAANGNYLLVRNHEISVGDVSPVPDLAYDPLCNGGTSTIELDANLQVVRHHLSLTGTLRNCAGGRTPWGTWLSCEEIFMETENQWHGYVFEVDPTATKLQKIMPLKTLGRFNHEAAGVDAQTGVVYLTEDTGDSCFYRHVPNARGQLHKGGQLQALRLKDQLRFHTSENVLDIGTQYECEWVDIPEPNPKEDTVRLQAQEKGAAIFVRGEGIWADPDGIYFTCTSGGAHHRGQVFKYTPGASLKGGTLELVYECSEAPLVNPDNLTISPWGDLIVCEDQGNTQNALVGLTPEGKRYIIASTMDSEWAGACFSYDGKVLFANIQAEGYSLGITGPWQELRKLAR